MNRRQKRGVALLVAALAAALGLTAVASAQARERCYGVARAGTADGVGTEERPGSGQVDYQGDAWVWVDAGACLTMTAPVQPDGTPRRGSPEPLARDLP
jgi:uncharacterized membrane protein